MELGRCKLSRGKPREYCLQVIAAMSNSFSVQVSTQAHFFYAGKEKWDYWLPTEPHSAYISGPQAVSPEPTGGNQFFVVHKNDRAD